MATLYFRGSKEDSQTTIFSSINFIKIVGSKSFSNITFLFENNFMKIK